MKRAPDIHLAGIGGPLCASVRSAAVDRARERVEAARTNESSESLGSCSQRWRRATAAWLAAGLEERVPIGPHHKATCVTCLTRLIQFPQLGNVRP